jgi:signal transduction histidine kinase
MEVEATRADLPEISTRTFTWVLSLYEQTKGRADLERVWEEEHMPLSLAHCEDTDNFVSLDFLERCLAMLVKRSANPRLITEAGRQSVSPAALGFAYYALRGLGSLQLAYRRTLEVAGTYNRVGSFTLEHIDAASLEVTYRSKRAERTTLVCEGRRATLAAFPTMWGLPEAAIKEVSCQVKGDDCCRYRLTWENAPPSRHGPLAGAILGAGIGLALWFAGLAGAPLAVASAALAGLCTAALLQSRAQASSTDALLREQTRQLSRSLEEIQKRADEIFEANVELDHRVAARTGELADALERLKRLDAQKSEFFANVSHELRTPLTLILVPIEDRLSSALPPAERELFSGIERHARRLLRLIDDLLDLSRIDAGQLRLDVTEIDLTALVTQVVRGFGAAAETRGIHLELGGPLSTTDVWGDLHRLESVLSNLVANALKFTPRRGTVSVTVRETNGEVCVSVSDTGPGIAADALPRIFDRFYQSSDGARRGGVGIGLALAKNLAELHRGRIAVESTAGEGSTFTLILPKGRAHFRRSLDEVRLGRKRASLPATTVETRARAAALPTDHGSFPTIASVGPPASLTKIQGRRPRILVVEDQPELREMLVEHFRSSCDVLSAEDGEPALALAKSHLPDLILSDVMMPGMSGSALCAAVKADPRLQSTPVVLLTARSGPEAALEGFGAGADEFVEKPFHPRVLVARVHAQLRLRAMSLQLSGNARLAAVGTLAAGVGHELRNPVNAVVNGARILQQQAAEGDAKRLLDVIVDGAQRIDQISSALLSHASPGDRGGARPFDVKEGLESTLRLLSYRLRDVTVERNYRCEAKVVTSAVELNQVFLNLIDNAVNAPARHIWITAAEDERKVKVTVADDGPGIPREVAAQVFDPFFTTREPGQGTGLGLYLSRQAVQRWGGVLQFSERPGGGTVFLVELPRETT